MFDPPVYFGRNLSRVIGISLRRMFAHGKYMTCPRCQKELPNDQKGNRCPFCGSSRILFHWFIFLCALLLPPILTLLSAATVRHTVSQPVNENISPPIALISGAIGGIVCGFLLAFRATKDIPLRIVLSIVLSALMIVVCVMLCLFGCSVGGYQFTIER
jgi:hypothetical protein